MGTMTNGTKLSLSLAIGGDRRIRILRPPTSENCVGLSVGSGLKQLFLSNEINVVNCRKKSLPLRQNLFRRGSQASTWIDFFF